MAHAIREARKAEGTTGIRPFVGCLLVKNGHVIAQSHTQRDGRFHAEAHALRKAGAKAINATLYSTLEPCHHNSQGIPCDRLIVASGIRRVVWGCHDPAPKNGIGGTRFLRKHRVRVTPSVLRDECIRLHEAFLTGVRHHRPFVLLSTAMTLDGKITWKKGQRVGISDYASLRRVHLLRSKADAIAVGIRTIGVDNPRLTARVRGGKDPDRVIFDSNATLSPTARVFLPSRGRVFVVTTQKPSHPRCRKLAKKGAVIVSVRKDRHGHADIPSALRALYGHGIRSLMVEGGGELIAAMLAAKVVDKAYFWFAPLLVGGASTPTGVEGKGLTRFSDAPRLRDIRIERVGNDVLFEGYLDYPDR